MKIIVSLKVAVFTSTRHRHHYVNIHLQNITAIQDPLCDLFSMPLINPDQQHQKTPKSILHEISAYEDSSKINNETFHLFSQSDHEDDEQPPLKKMNTNLKSSNNSAFNHIKPRAKSPSSSANKFKETIGQQPSAIFKTPIQAQNSSISTINQLPPTAVTVTPPLSIAETDLLQMIDKPIDADLNPEGKFVYKLYFFNHFFLLSDFADDEFFSTW